MTVELLAYIVCDIDERDHDEAEALLACFLSAAWPTWRCQSQ